MAAIRIFRIVHRKYADDPYSGRGGLYAASRWASRGQLVSYAAGSLALAALEKIAGAGRLSRLGEMVYAAADLDEAALWRPDREELPIGFDRRPPGKASRAFGDAWLRREESVALRLPSVVLSEGWNYALNPSHPDFADALAPRKAEPLRLDPRVLRRLQEDL